MPLTGLSIPPVPGGVSPEGSLFVLGSAPGTRQLMARAFAVWTILQNPENERRSVNSAIHCIVNKVIQARVLATGLTDHTLRGHDISTDFKLRSYRPCISMEFA